MTSFKPYVLERKLMTILKLSGSAILTLNGPQRETENLSSGVCEQHRHRPACASAQSDQRLCYSLFGKYDM